MLLQLAAREAGAKVTNSSDWLVRSRQQAIINRFVDATNAPANLNSGQVYVLIDAGAAHAEIYIIGPKQGHAADYAAILERWSRQDAEYSQENDYAAARVELSESRLFLEQATQVIELRSLDQAIRAAGLTPFIAASIPKFAELSPTNLAPAVSSRRSNLFAFTNGSPPNEIAVSASFTPVQIVGPWIMAFGPIAVLLFGSIYAIAFAKNPRIAVDRRRRLYKAFVLKGTLVAIGICLPFSTWLIGSGQLYPIADLWFGSSSSAPFMTMMMAGFPLPIILLVALNRVESRLFQSKDPDSWAFRPPRTQSKAVGSKLQVGISIGTLALGFAIYLGASFVPKELRDPFRIVGIAGLALGFSANTVGRFVSGRLSPKIDQVYPDDPLVQRVAEIARALQVHVARVTVVDSGSAEGKVGIESFGGTLTLNHRTLEVLDEPELDFGIAYALSQNPGRFVATTGLIVIPFAVAVAFLVPNVHGSARAFVMPGMMAVMVPVMLLFTPRMLRVENRRSLERALTVTLNASAARSYLEKTQADWPATMGAKRRSKFAAQRMEDLTTVSQKLGLS